MKDRALTDRSAWLGALRRIRAWADSLFPEAPPPPALTLRRALLFAAISAAAVALVLLRAHGSAPLDSLLAEDGPILLQTALTEGTPEALGRLLLGYLYLVPRLIAEVATIFPATFAPEVFAVLAASVAVGSGFVVWRASAGHIRSPALRGCLAVLVAFNPVSGLEAIASGAYAPWYMLTAAFWVLLWRPASVARALGGSLFVFATAASTPGSVALAPLAFLRAVAMRDRRDAVILAGFACGFALQAAVVMTHDDPAAPDPSWDEAVWREFLQRVVGSAALGLDLAGGLWELAEWGLYVAAALAMATLVYLLVRNESPRVRAVTAICIATSVGMFVASAYGRDFDGALAWTAGDYHGRGGRYAMFPALLLFSALFVQLDAKPLRVSARAWARARMVALALAAVAVVTSFDQGDSDDRGIPRWSVAVDQARETCDSQRRREVDIPISPPGWSIRLPCAELN